MVSVLENGDVSFTNIFNGDIIVEFPTEPNITVMNFSDSGEYFILGFENGNFIVYKYVEKFNNIFSGNVETIPYANKNKETLNKKQPKERRKKLFKKLIH